MPNQTALFSLIEKHLKDKGAFHVSHCEDTEGNPLVSGVFAVSINTPHVAFETYALAKAIADQHGGLKNLFPTCPEDNLHIYNAVNAEIHIQATAFPTCVEITCFVLLFNHKD